MKKYLIAASVLFLVGCSNDEVKVVPEKDKTVETEAEKTEVVKVLSEQEKKQLDYNIGFTRIKELDMYFDMYLKIRESNSKLALAKDKTPLIELAELSLEIEEELTSSYADLDTLYDKDYELKLNQYSKSLLETITALKLKTFASYKYDKREASFEDWEVKHNAYLILHDELMTARNDLIDYHNTKFSE